MKTRARLLLVALLLLAGSAVLCYQGASNAAAQWATHPPTESDKLTADLDGLSYEEAMQVVQRSRLVPAEAAMWPTTGGLLSLAVLDDRMQQLQWWRAYQLSGRLAAQAPGSQVSEGAAEIHRQLAFTILYACLALVVAGVGASELRRPSR